MIEFTMVMNMKNSDLENTLFSYISKIKHRSAYFIEKEARNRGIKLAYSHMRIIVILYFNKKLSMKELTERLVRDKSTVTSLVNKLETEGYIKKTICETDKRITYLELEDKSEEVIEVMSEISKLFQKKVDSILKKEETEILYKIMKKLADNW